MDKRTRRPLTHVTLILHDIRSVINVGSVFRTAEGFGVGHVILSGYTPGPLDRFGRVRQDFHKAALGAETHISFEHIQTEQEVILKIKEEGRKSIVLEQDERAIDIGLLSSAPTDTIEEKLALIVGNETGGVSPLFLEHADTVVEIPMFGKKESFNVSSATAIALYALL